MILSNRVAEFSVPHTSTCTIRTVGQIRNGDTVRLTSPVFPSHTLIKNTVQTSDEFELPIYLSDPNMVLESDGNLNAVLVCNDNDTLRMFVRDK